MTIGDAHWEVDFLITPRRSNSSTSARATDSKAGASRRGASRGRLAPGFN